VKIPAHRPPNFIPAPACAGERDLFPRTAQNVAPTIHERPPLVVSFQEGLLSISSDKASLSEVLYAIHQRTGAEIAIPAGAEQEKVMADLGPAPAPEVLAHLLNGSKFNFMILSSPTNPLALDQVILSPRADGMVSPGQPLQPLAQEENEAAIQPEAPPPASPNPPPTDPLPAPAPPNNDTPQ